jgi:hypothetical protein
VDWTAVDWLDGVAMLRPDERGIYDTIINLIYAHGEPDGFIEISETELAARCYCHWRLLRRVLATLLARGKVAQDPRMSAAGWPQDLYRITVERCQDELTKAYKRVSKASHAAEERWNINQVVDARENVQEYAKGNGQAMPRAQTQPSTINHQPSKQARAPSARESELEEKFAKFWSQYPSRKPHQNHRKPAREKFETKIRGGADPDEIIRGVELFAEQCAAARTEPNFIPTAVVWLNRDGWKDAIETGEVEDDDEDSRWKRRWDAEQSQWRDRVQKFLEDENSWDVEEWGAKPGEKPIYLRTKTCDCPPKIIQEFGIVPRFHDDGLDDAAPPPKPDPPPPPEADEPDFGF